MSKPSLKKLKEAAAAIGYTASLRDGEYRIAPNRPADRQWAEDRAYYTNCPVDALATIRAQGGDQ